ncbi:MAG: hypothetical protein U0166_09725 [Acidobacteriota bacterium]
MIISSDIEMTATIESSDIAFAANAWCEFGQPEITGSCSNPFLQIWKGSMKPTFDTKDDIMIMAELAKKIGEHLKDERFARYWQFSLDGRTDVYIQRLLDESIDNAARLPLRRHHGREVRRAGAALMLFRTYPRASPLRERPRLDPVLHGHRTDAGVQRRARVVLEYSENFIVHREGPEAMPYLPNVIVTSNPYGLPNDYGIPLDWAWGRRAARPQREDAVDPGEADEEPARWRAATSSPPLPRRATRPTVAGRSTGSSSGRTTSSGIPTVPTSGQPVGEHQLHVNPAAAKDLGLKEGDYCYVDANPADRPYVGWKPSDPFYRVARLMLRVKYNSSYPYNVVMMKHALCSSPRPRASTPTRPGPTAGRSPRRPATRRRSATARNSRSRAGG